MPINFNPRNGMVLICDFTTGFKPPEMVKRRPVVVIASRNDAKLCTVVPLSTTPPVPVTSHHHRLDAVALPGKLHTKETWAKCDMLCTVSLERLDRVKVGKDANGKRLYSSMSVSKEDFKAIQKGVLHALGFHVLTNRMEEG